MNRSRGTVDAPVGLTGSPLHTAPSKTNRLRRSFRQTQQTQTAADVDSPNEFKTPTRIPRSRAGGGFCGESPNNDSDFQQDIIWDATSPSPNRRGKRCKKPPGVVDISEIVSRIAPKHGRPTVAEPTLQQWIGDSAAIPCTPDVQVHKPKKSPRPNGVDDLLKLAKQFDFNMFRQDEEEVEDLRRRSLELLSEDILDLEGDDRSDVPLSPPANCQPAANGTDEQLPLDQHMEDDLDFLFDGPTQHLSVNLSQVSSGQVKPASKEASGKPPASSCGPTSGVSTANAKVTSAKDAFEDDWENDDLLNDSLVLEMTQNPQKFTAPQHCSTQKPPSQRGGQRESPADEVVRSVSNGERDNVSQRTTFKLESNPSFSFKRTHTDTWTNSKVDYSSKAAVRDSQQGGFSSGHGVLVEGGSRRTGPTSNPATSDPQKPQFHQRTSVATASNTSATKTAQSVPVRPATVSSRGEAPAVSDLPVWDDLADDDLLCEMCEDVENRLQSAEHVSAKQTLPGGHASNQRASSPLSNRNRPQHFDPKKQSLPRASGRPAGGSLTGSSASNIAAGVQTTGSFRLTQTKNTSGSTWTQGSSQVRSAPRGNPGKDQFTFRRPNGPVSTVSSNVVGKCSAAEIEQKKQQAMERRRQRLQAAQHLRAPT